MYRNLLMYGVYLYRQSSVKYLVTASYATSLFAAIQLCELDTKFRITTLTFFDDFGL